MNVARYLRVDGNFAVEQKARRHEACQLFSQHVGKGLVRCGRPDFVVPLKSRVVVSPGGPSGDALARLGSFVSEEREPRIEVIVTRRLGVRGPRGTVVDYKFDVV